MSAPPFMPLYVADYLADTTHLTTTEHGAYLLLLACMWRAGGSLPADDAKLARFAHLTPAQWARVRETIMAFFTLSDGVVTQARLTRELARHSNAVKQRREAASNGGKAKSLKDKEKGLPDGMLSACQPEPEPDKEYSVAKATAQSALKGEVEKAKPTEEQDPDTQAWALSVTVLTHGGLTDRQARSFFGGLLKRHGLRASEMLVPLIHCEDAGTLDAQSYLTQSAINLTTRRQAHAKPASTAKFEARQANLARAFAGAQSAARNRALG